MSDDTLVPRLCHLVKWPDFNGFGFNLHAERGKAGQFIGKVDEGSPAEAAGLKPRDRIVEVNGANIGNENHQQVVMRIKAGGDETKLLVVDDETDAKYKELKTVIRADLPEVLYKRADPRPGQSQGNDVEAEVEPSTAPSYEAAVPDSDHERYRPRYCHMRKWADFDGYGFNLHAEKDKPGQYIGKIDEGSPAEAAHLKEGDRIVEVNEENIEDCTHQQVIAKIKAGGSETRMLVVDKEVDAYYKSQNIKVHNGMPQIDRYVTPPTSGKGDDHVQSELQAAAVVAVAAAAPQAVDVEVEQGGIGSMEEPEPEVQAEPEPEPEQETLVAAQAEVVEAYSAATDEGPGLATEAAEAEEYQEQPPTSQEEEEAVEEEKVEAERIAEVEAEPEVAQHEAEDEQEVSEEAVATLAPQEAPQEAPEEPSEPEAPQAVNGEDEPVSQKPMNGQQTVISQPEPVREPEPTPAPAPAPAPVSNGDPLAISAKEMRERLAAKKRNDPRNQKMDFRTKHQLFEKM